MKFKVTDKIRRLVMCVSVSVCVSVCVCVCVLTGMYSHNRGIVYQPL